MGIIINGVIWRIYKATEYSRVFLMTNGKYTIGVCDLINRKIYIADGLPKELEKEVVQHEICHAINSMIGFYTDNECEEDACIYMGRYADETFLIADEILRFL